MPRFYVQRLSKGYKGYRSYRVNDRVSGREVYRTAYLPDARDYAAALNSIGDLD